MNVSQIMTEPVISVAPSDSLSCAAELLKKHGVGVLPVCDNNRIQGIVTDRDLVTRGLASDTDPSKCQISQVMTNNVVSISPDTELTEAAHIMAQKQLHRLPVVKEGNVVGMISLGDLAKNHPYSMEVSEALAEISEEEIPSVPEN